MGFFRQLTEVRYPNAEQGHTGPEAQAGGYVEQPDSSIRKYAQTVESAVGVVEGVYLTIANQSRAVELNQGTPQPDQYTQDVDARRRAAAVYTNAQADNALLQARNAVDMAQPASNTAHTAQPNSATAVIAGPDGTKRQVPLQSQVPDTPRITIDNVGQFMEEPNLN